MRKINKVSLVFVLLSFCVSISQVFGQSISLTVPEEHVDINEPFVLEVSVQGNSGQGQVRIDGIDPFEVRNQSSRTLMQSVNGDNRLTSELALEMQSDETGTYTVGPAQITIDGRVYESEQYQLVITGEKLFVNGAPQGWGATNNQNGLDTQLSDGTDSEQGAGAENQGAENQGAENQGAENQGAENQGADNQGRDNQRASGLIWFFVVVLVGLILVLIWKYRTRKKVSNKIVNSSFDATANTKLQRTHGEEETKLYSQYNKDLFKYDNTMARDEMQKQVDEVAKTIQAVKDQIQSVVIGQDILVRNLIIALLARGHILLEGVPGLAKTLSIETLAKTLGVDFNRIQFTPDLLPSDLVGSTLFNPKTAEFHVNKGPVFTNLLLADEINRAPAKVQSALLEAMAERQVTIGDETSALEDPFVVMATQNPLEQEGTYSLPEAQLDRFLLKTLIDYPSEDEEIKILEAMSHAQRPEVKEVWSYDDIVTIWKVIDQIYVSDNIFTYVKDLVFATRQPEQFGCDHIAQYIEYGVSPRGSLALIAAGKVIACMEGRDYLLPEDIQEIAYDVMRHRLVVSFQAITEDITPDMIIKEILHTVPVVDES